MVNTSPLASSKVMTGGASPVGLTVTPNIGALTATTGLQPVAANTTAPAINASNASNVSKVANTSNASNASNASNVSNASNTSTGANQTVN